ncbi:hypothetical protein L6452_37977 [Arctium lappa]|uniref:Uncharacterized protein n=1 Tax=Arctium lappa TaxID=4217 RepID=A0ACB8Y539_ARCLA|nr:hypothetical protein L6452_37977 [Arctium lappa]
MTTLPLDSRLCLSELTLTLVSKTDPVISDRWITTISKRKAHRITYSHKISRLSSTRYLSNHPDPSFIISLSTLVNPSEHSRIPNFLHTFSKSVSYKIRFDLHSTRCLI